MVLYKLKAKGWSTEEIYNLTTEEIYTLSEIINSDDRRQAEERNSHLIGVAEYHILQTTTPKNKDGSLNKGLKSQLRKQAEKIKSILTGIKTKKNNLEVFQSLGLAKNYKIKE